MFVFLLCVARHILVGMPASLCGFWHRSFCWIAGSSLYCWHNIFVGVFCPLFYLPPALNLRLPLELPPHRMLAVLLLLQLLLLSLQVVVLIFSLALQLPL